MILKTNKGPVVVLQRYKQDRNQSAGVGLVFIDNNIVFASPSLERGWRNNERNVSCLPEGEYDMVYEYSDKFNRKCWEIKGAEPRTECKFHPANYWKDLNGCPALGSHYKQIGSDSYLDIAESRDTIELFESVLSGYTKCKLIILNKLDENF